KSNIIVFLSQRTRFFYADQARVKWYVRDEGKVLKGGEDEFGMMLYGKATAYDLSRSVSSSRWYRDHFGPCGVWMEVEDNGFTRQFVVAARGVGVLAQLRDRGSTHSIAPAAQSEHDLVWTLSSFDQPPVTCAYCESEQNRDKKRNTKTEKQADDEAIRDGYLTNEVSSRPIDHFNDDLVAQWKLGKVQNRTFKGADDRDVQMFVVYPPDFDPKKKYPLVQMVHGGPHNAFHNEFSFRWNP